MARNRVEYEILDLTTATSAVNVIRDPYLIDMIAAGAAAFAPDLAGIDLADLPSPEFQLRGFVQ